METLRSGAARLMGRRAFIGGVLAAPLAGAALATDDMVFDITAMLPGEFTWRPERSPEGPVAILVSLPEQVAHVYRNGIRIGVSTISSGKPGHETPTGVFVILQKDRDHHSSIYNNASMPNTERLTWGGVALHAGGLPGYPSSHGCVHLPLEFSDLLFRITHTGTPVIVAGAGSDPWELIHPGLMLGASADTEMDDAVQALEARARPGDWTDGPDGPVVSVLVTGEDRKITLLEDGRELIQSPITIDGDPRLGEHVFVLVGFEGEPAGMRWVGLTHHPDPGNPLAPEAGLMSRISASDDFNAALLARLHVGMTLVVSDLAARPDRRSDDDFVIMTAVTDSPGAPPKPRPAGLDAG